MKRSIILVALAAFILATVAAPAGAAPRWKHAVHTLAVKQKKQAKQIKKLKHKTRVLQAEIDAITSQSVPTGNALQAEIEGLQGDVGSIRNTLVPLESFRTDAFRCLDEAGVSPYRSHLMRDRNGDGWYEGVAYGPVWDTWNPDPPQYWFIRDTCDSSVFSR